MVMGFSFGPEDGGNLMIEGRRQNGEGTIIQVSDTKWIAKIRMGVHASGEQRVKQFSGKTEAIVKKKLGEFKTGQDFLGKHMPCCDTISSYFMRWLRDYQYNKLKVSNYDRLESTVMNHIIPDIGAMKIGKVSRIIFRY